MRLAVISAHKGSLSWTRLLDQIKIIECIDIKYYYSFTDEKYRNNKSFFSQFILRFKTYIIFPMYFIKKSFFIDKNYDRVVVITSPFFLPYLAAIFLKNTKIVILYNDMYPEALVDKKIIKYNSLFYKLSCRFQLYTYKNTFFSVFIGSEHLQLAKSKYMLPNEIKYRVINVPSHLDTNCNKILFVETGITCIYSGTIGLFHDFELFIRFLSYIDKESRLNFIFNTNGAAKPKFENQLQAKFPHFLESKTVCLGNSVSSIQYELLMDKSQIGIIFQDLSAGTVVFPSKFASMLISGQAILAFMNKNCLMAKIILENDLGWVVDNINTVFVNEVLSEIYDEDVLFRKRVNAKKYGIDNYSISNIAKEWIDILKTE
jgi:hypothetical protein